MSASTSELVFACYSKACAPPPAGKGGSNKGGKKGVKTAAQRDAEDAKITKAGAKRAQKAMSTHRKSGWVDPRDTVRPLAKNSYFKL